ncbi:hypothetical protein [Nocardia sp. NPDC050710]
MVVGDGTVVVVEEPVVVEPVTQVVADGAAEVVTPVGHWIGRDVQG